MSTFKYPICQVTAYAILSETVYDEIPDEELNNKLIEFAEDCADDWDEDLDIPLDELWITLNEVENEFLDLNRERAAEKKVEEWEELPAVCKVRDFDPYDNEDEVCEKREAAIHEFMLRNGWFKVEADYGETIYGRKK